MKITMTAIIERQRARIYTQKAKKIVNCVVRYSFFKNIAQLFIKFTHSFVAIELLTLCKNAK